MNRWKRPNIPCEPRSSRSALPRYQRDHPDNAAQGCGHAEALVPFATLGELLTGMNRVADWERESIKIRTAVRAARIVYPNQRTLACYGRINAHLQRLGLPIPINDVWNAALAVQWDVPLLADDAHFNRVPGLKFILAR